MDLVLLRRSGSSIGHNNTRVDVTHVLGRWEVVGTASVVGTHQTAIGEVTRGYKRRLRQTCRTKPVTVVVVVVIFIGVHDAIGLIVGSILTYIGYLYVVVRLVTATACCGLLTTKKKSRNLVKL